MSSDSDNNRSPCPSQFTTDCSLSAALSGKGHTQFASLRESSALLVVKVSNVQQLPTVKLSNIDDVVRTTKAAIKGGRLQLFEW